MERTIALIILVFVLFVVFHFQAIKFIKTVKMPSKISRLKSNNTLGRVLIILFKIVTFFVVLITQFVRFCFETAWKVVKRF